MRRLLGVGAVTGARLGLGLALALALALGLGLGLGLRLLLPPFEHLRDRQAPWRRLPHSIGDLLSPERVPRRAFGSLLRLALPGYDIPPSAHRARRRRLRRTGHRPRRWLVTRRRRTQMVARRRRTTEGRRVAHRWHTKRLLRVVLCSRHAPPLPSRVGGVRGVGLAQVGAPLLRVHELVRAIRVSGPRVVTGHHRSRAFLKPRRSQRWAVRCCTTHSAGEVVPADDAASSVENAPN